MKPKAAHLINLTEASVCLLLGIQTIPVIFWQGWQDGAWIYLFCCSNICLSICQFLVVLHFSTILTNWFLLYQCTLHTIRIKIASQLQSSDWKLSACKTIEYRELYKKTWDKIFMYYFIFSSLCCNKCSLSLISLGSSKAAMPCCLVIW